MESNNSEQQLRNQLRRQTETSVAETIAYIRFEIDLLEDKIGDALEIIQKTQAGIGIWKSQLDSHARNCEPCNVIKELRGAVPTVPKKND